MKFADTNFLVGLLNPEDQWHAAAERAVSELSEPVLTTAWVLVELGDALSLPRNRPVFLDFVDALSRESAWEVVPATMTWFAEGLALFRARPDKDWPLTDCISFVVMTQRGVTDALTHDHHFEQAGFRALLRGGA